MGLLSFPFLGVTILVCFTSPKMADFLLSISCIISYLQIFVVETACSLDAFMIMRVVCYQRYDNLLDDLCLRMRVVIGAAFSAAVLDNY